MKLRNYFKSFEINTLEELKSAYRKLAMQYHPDMGGSTEAMQEINNQYDNLFSKYKNIHKNKDGETYTAREETTEAPEEFRNIIMTIIHLEGITIELCGSWLWITGDTKPHKDVLKSVGFRFSAKKSAWYYHRESFFKKSKNKYSLDDIRSMYGSAKVVDEDNSNKLTA